MERVTSKVSVRNTREKDDKVHEFPVMRSLDRPAVSSLSRSTPLKSSKQERKTHIPVKKPRHELTAPKLKTEASDLIMPTLGGGGASSTGGNGVVSTGETITAQIIGLPDDHDIKQSEKVESKRPEVNSIFSPGKKKRPDFFSLLSHCFNHSVAHVSDLSVADYHIIDIREENSSKRVDPTHIQTYPLYSTLLFRQFGFKFKFEQLRR